MEQVSCEQQGSDVNMYKKEIPEREITNREIFPFNRSYFQFYTPTNIFCYYVDSTREIVLFCIFMNSPRYHIYNIDEYLISMFSCSKLNMNMIESVQMFFSDYMFVLLVSSSTYMHELMQYNEYTVVRRNFRNQRNICFDCDKDYIYESRTLMNVNYIDLYTHGVQIIRTINPIWGINIEMKVQNNSAFLLNKPQFPSSTNRLYSATKLVQISLKSGKQFKVSIYTIILMIIRNLSLSIPWVMLSLDIPRLTDYLFCIVMK